MTVKTLKQPPISSSMSYLCGKMNAIAINNTTIVTVIFPRDHMITENYELLVTLNGIQMF